MSFYRFNDFCISGEDLEHFQPTIERLRQAGRLTEAKLSKGLGYACLFGQAKAVEMLIQNGAAVNVTTAFGTPLNLAVEKGFCDVLDVLLSNGADPDYIQETRLGSPAIIVACQKSNVDMFDRLVAAGANVNIRDKSGSSCFRHAIDSGCIPILDRLVTNGANLEAPVYNDVAHSPLMYACSAHIRNVEVIRRLVSYGCDTNAQINGVSPLMIARCSEENSAAEVVRILLENGADPTLVVNTNKES